MKRVLMVAPTDALLPGVNGEIQNVVNSGLRVRLLSQNVTEDVLADELNRGDYRTLWFSSHSGPDGVLLSHGARLETTTLVQLLRGTTIELVFLNSCSSLQIAQDLQVEADVAVIATVIDVPDTVAYRTGTQFAHWLASTGDYRLAQLNSRPGRNRTYVFLDNWGKWRRVNEEILQLLRLMQKDLQTLLSRPVDDDRDSDSEVSNRYMIVIITAAILISASIFFLALRLAGG